MAEPADPAPPVSKATLAGVVIFVAALVALLLFVPGRGKKVAPEVVDGSKIFASHCAICHGPDGHGKGRFPRVAGTAKTEAEIGAMLENGKGDMPALEATPAQRQAVIQFVKGLK